MNHVVAAEFNSEKYWETEGYTKLPAISDSTSNNIILCMDELMFPFLNKGDLLVTRFKFNNILKTYLNSIGFQFNCTEDMHIEGNGNIFEEISENKDTIDEIKKYIDEDTVLSSYSIIPSYNKVAELLNIKCKEINCDVIKNINSKVYSYQLNKKLKANYEGAIISNSNEILEQYKILNKGNGVVLKEPYGVSGKGNLFINSEAILNRVVRFISSQEKKGLKTSLIMEPFLEKEEDFSCQFNIREDGEFSLVSVQKMLNFKFNYGGSYKADEDFIKWLEDKGYIDMMKKVGIALYNDGYFGDVCVDSMILKNGEIVPIIEINGRKSMGFINNAMDKYLEQFGLKSHLCFFNIGYKGKITFNEIFEYLDEEKLLFNPARESGVIPMSANTVFINRDIDKEFDEEKVYKGRFYLSIATKSISEVANIENELRNIFRRLSINVYN
ncbi:hypothetical protein [uncultured Clostridium sp.]|uniref:hypothetical protein n=1 Tax=uncultured Clostridium sp. TaxID=59620 RepID=UPI0025E68144|nr:hypothetical protein [uncultured Clostridium sp.]